VRCCWHPAATCICIFAVTLYFYYFIGFSILLLMRKCFLIIVTRIANFRMVNCIHPSCLVDSLLLNSKKNYPKDCLFCFYYLIKSRETPLFCTTFQRVRSNVIYNLFSIFYYCQKICKDVEKENHDINGNKEISSRTLKKENHDINGNKEISFVAVKIGSLSCSLFI